MTATTTEDRLRAVLNDVDYPADKDQLLEHAQRNAADDETVRALRSIPPVTYGNFQEVLQSVPLDPGRDESQRAAQRRTHTHPRLAEQAKDVPANPIKEELEGS
jgi:hypothetical protein